MGVVNRRNAVVGWAVVKLGKRAAKQKAKDVVPSREAGGKAGAALGAAVAAFFGVLAFRHRRRGGDSDGD